MKFKKGDTVISLKSNLEYTIYKVLHNPDRLIFEDDGGRVEFNPERYVLKQAQIQNSEITNK